MHSSDHRDDDDIDDKSNKSFTHNYMIKIQSWRTLIGSMKIGKYQIVMLLMWCALMEEEESMDKRS